MNDPSPPKAEGRPETALQTAQKCVGRIPVSTELSTDRDRLKDKAEQILRIREDLLQLACSDPDKFSPLIRPAAQIDKAYRLIKEFLEPRPRRPLWWQEESR